MDVWISFCLNITFEFLLYSSCYWSNYDLCVMCLVPNISSNLKFSSRSTLFFILFVTILLSAFVVQYHKGSQSWTSPKCTKCCTNTKLRKCNLCFKEIISEVREESRHYRDIDVTRLQKKAGVEQDVLVTKYYYEHQGDVWRILKKATFGEERVVLYEGHCRILADYEIPEITRAKRRPNIKEEKRTIWKKTKNTWCEFGLWKVLKQNVNEFV